MNSFCVSLLQQFVEIYLVNLIPDSLLALPELFECENDTHGGLPIIISVSGSRSISS